MKQEAKVGDRIRIINGGVFLGKWIKVGTAGIIRECPIDEDGHIYRVEISGELYTLASNEFTVASRICRFLEDYGCEKGFSPDVTCESGEDLAGSCCHSCTGYRSFSR